MINELRQLLAKGVSILLAFCYLFSPLHNQIGDVLHSFSHGLESPEYILSHTGTERDNGHHSHQEHKEGFSDTDHDHFIVSFVKNMLEASTQTDPFKDQHSLIKIDLDKHYFEGKKTLASTLINLKNGGIYYSPQKPSKGYPLVLYSPPIIS